jgi:hypothetical protein
LGAGEFAERRGPDPGAGRGGAMPQFQQHKKGQARIRVLSEDSTRAYMLMMRNSAGRLQVLSNDVYVVEEKLLDVLTENGIRFEKLE